MTKLAKNKTRVILSGGGTVGSVTPLLAIAEVLTVHWPDLELKWIGTQQGPERQLVEQAGIGFIAISSGKWRRYWSIDNFIDIFKIIGGFFQSLFWLSIVRPQVVVSAGSFVSVPLAWAARLLFIPVVIEQLDYRPGLANKLMAPIASQVVVTLEKSLGDYGAKAIWLGAPVRQSLLTNDYSAIKLPWSLKWDQPIVLIMGGGTGAMILNNLVVEQLSLLTKQAQIVHITGAGKQVIIEGVNNYFSTEFINQQQLAVIYQQAKIVVARAGLGTMIELAAFKKASIIVPMPNSHQLDNAQVLKKAGAAIIAPETDLVDQGLARLVEQLLNNPEYQQQLISNWPVAIKIARSTEIIKIFERYL